MLRSQTLPDMPPWRSVPGRCLVFCLLTTAIFLIPHAGRAQADTVRVWVFASSPPAEATIRASNGVLRIRARGGSNRVLEVDDQRPVAVRAEDNGVRLKAPGAAFSAERIIIAAEESGHLVIDTPSQHREYHGRLFVNAVPGTNDLRMINHVGMTEYLASVVPSEYPFDDSEGAKAQAVIARTYAVRAAENAGEPYDVTDNTSSQAYGGIGRETRASRQAVQATQDEILTYRGRPIEAVYSSSSGGHTADNETVWTSDPVPYLRGKPDPYDESSPHQDWRFSVSQDVLHEMLSEEYGFPVNRVAFGDRTDSGRHHTITLYGGQEEVITANDLRFIISRRFGARSLKSTRFSVRSTGDQYIFEGQGFGHGVGMSQWGAHARAEDGHSYREILQFYYAGVSLETVTGDQVAAAQTPSPEAEREPTGATEPAVSPRAPATGRTHGGWGASPPLSLDDVPDRPQRPGW